MTDLTKNRLIYAEDAIGALIRESTCDGAYRYVDTKRAVETIKQLPFVEIIRCRNCKHHILHKRLGIPWCRLLHIDMGDNEFCSCGERREDE